jgi:MtN3 and saliva related transmembrane protein
MILDQLITGVVTVVGVSLSFAYYPQAWRIWRTKSAGDISMASIVLFVVGTNTWLLYGLYREDVAIIASFLFGAIGSVIVLLLTLYFRRKKVKSEPQE